MALQDETQLLSHETEDTAAEVAADAVAPQDDASTQDTANLGELPVITAEAAQAPDDETIEAQLALKNLEKRRADKRRKRRLRIGAACVLAGGIIAVLAGRHFAAPSAETEEVAPQTAVVERADFSNTITASGALKAGSTVVVTPEVDGIIQEIRVSEGQEVKEGDVLFTLKNDSLDKAVRDAQQDLDDANRAVSNAQAEVDRAVASRDAAWNKYYEEFDEAQRKHAEWEDVRNNYDQLHAEWESRAAAAEAIAVDKPSEPKVPADPGENGTEQQKQEYQQKFDLYQTEYSQYLEDSAEYDAYQNALALVGEEPQPAGEEPTYPDAPEDSSLQAAIDSAQEAVGTANAAVTKAREAYDEAVEKADKRIVKAPTSGNVVAVGADVGEAVGGATGGTSSESNVPLVQISDINKMAVDVEVNEIDIMGIKPGQPAKVTFSAVPDLEVDAQVSEVATVASGNGEGGGIVTFHVGLVIPRPDKQLRPGMTATVSIYTVDQRNVLVVPVAAVTEGDLGATVQVVVDQETMQTESRPVTTGARNTSDVVIEEGLTEGETLLVSPGSVEGDEELEG